MLVSVGSSAIECLQKKPQHSSSVCIRICLVRSCWEEKTVGNNAVLNLLMVHAPLIVMNIFVFLFHSCLMLFLSRAPVISPSFHFVHARHRFSFIFSLFLSFSIPLHFVYLILSFPFPSSPAFSYFIDVLSIYCFSLLSYPCFTFLAVYFLQPPSHSSLTNLHLILIPFFQPSPFLYSVPLPLLAISPFSRLLSRLASIPLFPQTPFVLSSTPDAFPFCYFAKTPIFPTPNPIPLPLHSPSPSSLLSVNVEHPSLPSFLFAALPLISFFPSS